MSLDHSPMEPQLNPAEVLAKQGYVLLPADAAETLLRGANGYTPDDWRMFQASWDRLELDRYMADGGAYRHRRHGTYSASPSGRAVRQEPHQAHYQSLAYNRLNGGVARHFAPLETEVAQGPVLNAVLSFCRDLFGRLAPALAWHIEVHQFRIDASGSVAKPTPEGVHRDGVNFVFMMLVQRLNVLGGETRIHDQAGRPLVDHTLSVPLDTAIVNDERVLHGVTPIAPLVANLPACRDVLVVTFSGKPPQDHD